MHRYVGRARFYIETKTPEAAPGMEEALVALLRAFHLVDGRLDGLPAVIVQSFSAASLARVATLAPSLPRILLLEEAPEAELVAGLAEVAGRVHGIGPSRHSTGAALIAAARSHDLVVHPYTVNDEPEMRRLLTLGVDGLFTDRPDVLLALSRGSG